VCLVIGAGCGANESLLKNGGFEPHSEVEKTPYGWFATVVPHTAEWVEFTWDDRVKRSGRRSVSIAIDAEHPDEQIAYNWTRTASGWVEGGTYELTGWIKTEDLAETAWIVVQCWNEELSEMLGFATTQHDYPITGTSDWTLAGLVFEVPPQTKEVRVRVGIATPANRGGRAWFDDLSIKQLQ
jgi:hypothetical protein